MVDSGVVTREFCGERHRAMEQRFDALTESVDLTRDQVTQLHTRLFVGNGAASFAVQVERLTQFMEAYLHEQMSLKEQRFRRRLQWYATGVAAFIGLAGLLVGLFVK